MGRASRLALPLVLLNGQGYCQCVSTLSSMLSLVITLPPNLTWVHDNDRGPRAFVTSSMGGHDVSGSAGAHVSRVDPKLSGLRSTLSCWLMVIYSVGVEPEFRNQTFRTLGVFR